jgi:hypothetical protein
MLAARPGQVNAAGVEADGSGVVFERTQGAVYPFEFNPYVVPEGGTVVERFDRRTGEVSTLVRRIGGAFSPALSPDGKRLAYLNRHLDEVRLIVRNLDTREERTLATGLDFDRQGSGSGYGAWPVIAWHPNGQRVFLNSGGKVLSVDAATGQAAPVPFTVHVERQMSETIRFPSKEAEGRAKTRTHRWGVRTPQGIVFEALGDLWLQDASGARKNLTQSDANETSPAFDPKSGALYYASWTDDSLGAVFRMPSPSGGARERLTAIPAQYGSVAVAPDGRVAYVRGAGGVERGAWLSNETDFELVVRGTDGRERRVTGISSQPLLYADVAGKIPPSVHLAAAGATIAFTEFEHDTLMLKRVGADGSGEVTLIKFPHAVAAVPSPDLRWVALREYQRSFLTSLSYFGQPTVVSPYDGSGTSSRIDAEDGGYLTWSADAATISWMRATGFYEKTVERILAERGTAIPVHVTTPAAWNAPRVPGSTAQRTETAIDYEVYAPSGVVALTGARVVTMNKGREVIEGATVIVRGARIAAIGRGIAVPAGAKVYDVAGATIIPGIVDAHAHPHIEHSALHVIEQQPTYLSGPLAYGVTTVVEVYGN